jgi:aminoglycoside/choline kinase family phosphotransferase
MNNDLVTGKELAKLTGDSSGKCFFKIVGTDYLLLQFPLNSPRSDEYFIDDRADLNLKQEDFYVKAGEFLWTSPTLMKKTAQIIHFDRTERTVILQDLGSTSLFNVIETQGVNAARPYYHAAIHLIKALGHTQLIDPLNMRTLESCSFYAELGEYLEWALEGQSIELLQEELEKLIVRVDSQKKVTTHRDFQSKNIMIYKNEPYVIDYQDLCMGPEMYDLASLLYDANAQLPEREIDSLANYYNDDGSQLKSLRETALLRVLKNIGRHAKYSLRDNRAESAKSLIKNKKVLELLREQMSEYQEYEQLFQLLY